MLVCRPSQHKRRLTDSRLHEWKCHSVEYHDQEPVERRWECAKNGGRLKYVENALKMVDDSALTKNGLHFNTQQGIQWINDAFQTKIEEMQIEVRMMVNPVARGSSASRVRSQVPQPLADRLGPLTTEANVVQPSPSSNLREMLGTAPAPRGWSLENRIGTIGGPPQRLRAPQANLQVHQRLLIQAVME